MPIRHPWRRARLASLLPAIVLMAVLPLQAQSAPRALHAPFDSLLRIHVRDGRVDYDALQHAPAFARYLETLALTTSVEWPRAKRLAFLINAYNAYTIAQVNAHGERRSIRNINKRFGVVGSGAWGERMVTIGSVAHTLDEIEHQLIRPVFKEPRVHFALVCAALGCPPLHAEAYTGERLEAQLEEQARVFLLDSPQKNRAEAASRTVYLSPIFRWYRDDFGASDAAMLRYFATFLPRGAKADVLARGDARIRWTEYDWSLNARSRGTPAARSAR